MAPPAKWPWKKIEVDIRAGMRDCDVVAKWTEILGRRIPLSSVCGQRLNMGIAPAWISTHHPAPKEGGPERRGEYGPNCFYGEERVRESMERKLAALEADGIPRKLWLSGPAGRQWQREIGVRV